MTAIRRRVVLAVTYRQITVIERGNTNESVSACPDCLFDDSLAVHEKGEEPVAQCGEAGGFFTGRFYT